VPKSTPRIQLPGFSTLYTGLSGCVTTLMVRSFVSKAELIKFILWHWIRAQRMQLCLTLCTRCVKFFTEQKMVQRCYCTPTWNFSSIWWLLLFRSTAQSTRTEYTSQLKMRNYAVRFAMNNSLFQLRYLFDFTLSVFSLQSDWFGECPNRKLLNKHHWDYKSFMTPQANKSVKSLRTAPSCIRTNTF